MRSTVALVIGLTLVVAMLTLQWRIVRALAVPDDRGWRRVTAVDERGPDGAYRGGIHSPIDTCRDSHGGRHDGSEALHSDEFRIR